jgi:site-specific DNA-methyltransferase (adenine-specific)
MEKMSKLPDKYFGLACVDPPYGMPKDSTHGRGKLKNRILNSGGLEKWDIPPTKEYFDELFRVSKNQIIWGGNYFGLPPNRCFIIWDKQQPFENFSAAEYAWTSFDEPSKIFREATTRTGENKIHPTQKSVRLYKFCLANFAKEGDIIFDSHMGSQSSRIAAYEMCFDYVGCETSLEYYNLGNLRFEDFKNQARIEFPLRDEAQQTNLF